MGWKWNCRRWLHAGGEGFWGLATVHFGILGSLDDFAVLERSLVDVGVAERLDKQSVVTAMRRGGIDVLIVAPRDGPTTALPMDLHRETPDSVALFVLVPQGDTAALALAFDGGATDCAAYPIDPDEVRIRIGALLARKAVADQLRTDAAEVRRMAHTDPVTGLWNRHYLDAELTVKIANAAATNTPLSVLMIDIDRFKPINDKHGHAIGDKVLRAVANRLSAGIRAIDTLARFGGDELVLVMPNAGLYIASGVAERLRALVADGTTEVPFGITISIGVAELNLDEPAAAVLAKADAALYEAKMGGRNRVAEAS